MSEKQAYKSNFEKLNSKEGASQLNGLSEAQMLAQLQDILLSRDRESLEEIKATLEKKELLSEKISPIIEDHLDFIKENFPVEFEKSVERIIDYRIKDSQEELLNVIYPKLGKMVQKYIYFQFQQLRESIDNQFDKTLNSGFLGWVRRTIFGIKASDEILNSVNRPIIEEIYVIQRDSGLLVGSASLNPKMHEDVMAGMLTAIKGFAEDAFLEEKADLEEIQYDAYRLFLQNFPSYYIAVALSGSMSSRQREELSNDLLTFAEKEMKTLVKNINSTTNFNIKQKLQEHFIVPQQKKIEEEKKRKKKL